MTDPEKLDWLLQALYKKPGKRGHLIVLLQEHGIAVTLDEAYRFGQTLGDANYVLYKPTLDDVLLALTADGINFMETSSFAVPETALVDKPANPYTLYNALVNESGQVTITIAPENIQAAKQVLAQIRTVVDGDATIKYEIRRGIFDCLEAVEYGIDSGGSFNGYNLLALLEIAFATESIAGLAEQLLLLFD